MAAATARSCAGFRYECRRQTTTASTPSARRRADLVHVERGQHAPLVIESLGDLEAEAARNERRGLLQVHVVEARADLTADLEDVAEAARHQHADPRRLAFDDRVRRDRR